LSSGNLAEFEECKMYHVIGQILNLMINI